MIRGKGRRRLFQTGRETRPAFSCIPRFWWNLATSGGAVFDGEHSEAAGESSCTVAGVPLTLGGVCRMAAFSGSVWHDSLPPRPIRRVPSSLPFQANTAGDCYREEEKILRFVPAPSSNENALAGMFFPGVSGQPGVCSGSVPAGGQIDITGTAVIAGKSAVNLLFRAALQYWGKCRAEGGNPRGTGPCLVMTDLPARPRDGSWPFIRRIGFRAVAGYDVRTSAPQSACSPLRGDR